MRPPLAVRGRSSGPRPHAGAPAAGQRSNAATRTADPPRRPLAFASDTASIMTMEIVDNLFVLLVPGAIADGLVWWSLAVGLLIAATVAYSVNRWLIARGRGTLRCMSSTPTRRDSGLGSSPVAC